MLRQSAMMSEATETRCTALALVAERVTRAVMIGPTSLKGGVPSASLQERGSRLLPILSTPAGRCMHMSGQSTVQIKLTQVNSAMGDLFCVSEAVRTAGKLHLIMVGCIACNLPDPRKYFLERI